MNNNIEIISIRRLDNFGLFITHSLSGNLNGENGENINKILQSISPEELIESTFGIEKSEYIKYSKISTRKFKIIINESHICNIVSYLDYLEYPIDGKFIVNIDKIASDNYHTYTVHIYPPQDIEGGELIIYEDDRKSLFQKINISKTNWVVVVFPIDIYHSSNEIKKGTKKMFKGVGIIKDSIKKRSYCDYLCCYKYKKLNYNDNILYEPLYRN
jgi:hypothetical protein